MGHHFPSPLLLSLPTIIDIYFTSSLLGFGANYVLLISVFFTVDSVPCSLSLFRFIKFLTSSGRFFWRMDDTHEWTEVYPLTNHTDHKSRQPLGVLDLACMSKKNKQTHLMQSPSLGTRTHWLD